MSSIDVKMLRDAILERAERVRIKRNGESHAFGKMPNSNKVGWYFVGYDADIIKNIKHYGRAY